MSANFTTQISIFRQLIQSLKSRRMFSILSGTPVPVVNIVVVMKRSKKNEYRYSRLLISIVGRYVP
jgi:hypothetical protein